MQNNTDLNVIYMITFGADLQFNILKMKHAERLSENDFCMVHAFDSFHCKNYKQTRGCSFHGIVLQVLYLGILSSECISFSHLRHVRLSKMSHLKKASKFS